MPCEFDVPTRDAAIAAILILLGTDAKAKVFTGSRPANTTVADSGTKLAEFSLAGTWFDTPITGAQGELADVFNTDAIAGGVPGYVRFYSSDGTCRLQAPIVVAPTAIPADGGFQVSHSPWVIDEPVRLATTMFRAAVPGP